MRLARVFAATLSLFEGSVEPARRWFVSPQPALGGATPEAGEKVHTVPEGVELKGDVTIGIEGPVNLERHRGTPFGTNA